MEQPKQPQYLKADAPGDDLYQGKPQERVAQAIAGVIREDQFKLLGLDGTWGAGKSNVIRILQKLLDKTHHLFIYDTWSHQEDPQRRVFLEEFTRDLIENKLVKSGSWPKDLKELLAKQRDTNTKTIPKISPAYYSFVIALLLFPLAKSLSEVICEDDVWWRLLVQYLPAILLLLLWIIAACFSSNYRNLSTMLSIYKEKDLEKVSSETISETEPTVRQFRDWMTRLSEDLGKKSVVVVFDNLDRLPADKVKALWSAIQTFLSESREHYPRISFIVPFDRAHISKAFDDSDPEGPPIGSDFINKTFPIIFNVALPPLTGWQGFFRVKFNEAFGAILGGTYEQIVHIFDLYHPNITPRSIIHFINALVTLRLIWKEEIDMRYMALFISAKADIMKEPLNQILHREFAGKADLYFKGDDELAGYIAALLYNVPLEMASQVALYREIQTAFRAQDTERINSFHQHPDFFAILRTMIPTGDLSVQDLVFALSLLESNANTPEDKASIIQLWSSVAGKQIAQPGTILKIEAYHGILIEKLLGSPKLWSLINHIVDTLYEFSSGTGDSYFTNLDALYAVLKQHDLEGRMLGYIRSKSVSPDYFLAYVSAAKERYKRYKVSTDPVALDYFLVNMVNTEFPSFSAMKFIGEEYDLPHFQLALRAYLENKDSSPAFLYPALFANRHLNRYRPVKIPFSKERINYLLQLPDLNDDLLTELLAMHIAAGDDDIITEPHRGFDFTTEPLVPQIADTVEYYINLDELLARSLSLAGRLTGAVIRRITLNPSPSSKVDLKKILSNVNNLQSHLDLHAGKIFEAFDVWYRPIPGQLIMPVNYLPNYFPGFDFVALATQYPENHFARDLIAVAKAYVSAAEQSQWLKAFTDDSDILLDLTLTLLKTNQLNQLPPDAYEPFKESLLHVVQGQPDTDKQLVNRYIYLAFLKVADSPIESEVVRTLRDTIEAGKAAPSLLEFARYLDREYYGPVQIIRATYSSIKQPENSADVTAIVRQIVENDQLLHYHINNETMGGDPDSGFLKKLSVEFKWAEKEIRMEWKEGEYWRLPNG